MIDLADDRGAEIAEPTEEQLRFVGRPHRKVRFRFIEQSLRLDRLGIILPKRMRPAEHERPALARSV